MSPAGAQRGRAAPGSDLFDAQAAAELARRGPLAARCRPRRLADVVGQEQLVGPDGPLRAMAESGRLRSCVLWGPPGTGKTTLALLLAEQVGADLVTLSATEAGVADVRRVLADARRLLGEQSRPTVLFMDEVHRFNRAQQEVLLPGVEDGSLCFVGATTENPFFSLVGPLVSRVSLFRLEPLSRDEVEQVLRRGLALESADAQPEALGELAELSGGDARSALGALELALAAAVHRSGAAPAGSSTSWPMVTAHDVEAARIDRSLRASRDDHYDLASAFIKSIRGSDPDAGLYWMARMLEGGEDVRFVARRLVILASEDIGLAEPMALVVAQAAAAAAELVGLPEASLCLAEAVVFLAVAPKSNRVTEALGRARQDVERGQLPVPATLRDASYRSAARLDHGVGYDYPHGHDGAWVDAPYRPPELEGHRYYRPSDRGAEAELPRRDRGSGGLRRPGGEAEAQTPRKP